MVSKIFCVSEYLKNNQLRTVSFVSNLLFWDGHLGILYLEDVHIGRMVEGCVIFSLRKLNGTGTIFF